MESPDRLTTPLRKTAAGLKPVSWDDALDFAADRLTAIRAKYGPNALVRNGGAPVSYDARDGFVHFMQRYGSSNFTGSANCCWLPRATAFQAVMGGKPEPDFERANLIVFWGANPVATDRYGNYCAYPGFNRIISRAKARGARLVAIDPFRSETVERAGEWIRIRPGTDDALGLAMIHVVIDETLYDQAFVAQHTVGFDALKQHVRDYTPDWAAAITGIDPAEIVALARSFATAGPVAVCDGNGFDMYCNVVDAVRTLAILLGLTGNVDVPGGSVFLPFAKQAVLASPRKGEQIWRDRFPLFRDVPFPGIKESILRDEDDRPRAMIVHHSNPILIQANQNRTREAFGKLEFVLVDDLFLTATAEVADLVLPATSPLERWGYRAYASFDRGFVALSRPVVAPVGESRDVFSMEYEIAQRMGLGTDYPFSNSRSWVAHMLTPAGVTLEQLEHEQIAAVTPAPQYRKYETAGFQTPSRKLELWSSQFEKAGYDPLPVYREASGAAMPTASPAAHPFPLLCASRRPGQFVHTRFRNIKTLTESYPEPLLRISPDDAAARGICAGEMIELSSPIGQVTLRTKFDAHLEPGVVMMDFGWGNPTDRMASMNLLTSDEYLESDLGQHPATAVPVRRRQSARMSPAGAPGPRRRIARSWHGKDTTMSDISDHYSACSRRTACRAAGLMLTAILASPWSNVAGAQTYPNRPVRIIVPYGPGGIADVTLRLTALKLSAKLGQQFIIDNRPGAAGIVGITAVVNAPPDGYTLAMIGGGLTTAKALFKTLPYDLERDLVPVSSTSYSSLVMATKAGSPFKTVGDVIAAARANPGKLNFGSINPGSTQHLSGELFKSLAGVDATSIPYKTTPELLTAMLRGDVDVLFEYQAPLQGALDDRQVTAIATTGSERAIALPDVPTVAESGVPGYEATSWNGLAAPAGTPADIVALLNAAVVEAVAQPDVQKTTARFGMESRGCTVEELRKRISGDVAKWCEGDRGGRYREALTAPSMTETASPRPRQARHQPRKPARHSGACVSARPNHFACRTFAATAAASATVSCGFARHTGARRRCQCSSSIPERVARSDTRRDSRESHPGRGARPQCECIRPSARPSTMAQRASLGLA